MNDGQTEPRIVAALPVEPARELTFMRFARAAYDSYVGAMPLRDAATMPPWDLLADCAQRAWAAAARGVIIEQQREV